jgi:hypothetical protein
MIERRPLAKLRFAPGKVKEPLVPMRLLLVLVLGACAAPLPRAASFPARPDTIEAGDLRGPFDGQVLDAETDRPIAGALVYASWSFAEGTGGIAPAGWRDKVVSTDASGRYSIPRLGGKLPGRLVDFRLVIYKRGYVAYRSDHRFEDFAARTDFAQRNLRVDLPKWRPELSHARHLRYVGGGATLAELTRWEVAEALAEVGGVKPQTKPGDGETLPAAPQVLHAERLLGPSDVKLATGFAGSFDVRELGDEPTSERYDSLHLQARGKDEAFDVALRVWHLPPEEAVKHFEELLAELPGAKATSEIGDRSFRTATPKGDILGLGTIDLKRGSVLLILCGASQCRTHETLLMLMRTAKERLEIEIPEAE